VWIRNLENALDFYARELLPMPAALINSLLGFITYGRNLISLYKLLGYIGIDLNIFD
jgi:hypothetical protein